MAYEFTGKRCFVTGAASGIGRATALRLAREGAELFLTDRLADGLESVVEEITAAGGVVSAHRALDISDYDAVAAFAADILATHPSMDVLLNIAGISVWGSVDRLTHQQWRSVVDINLMGPIHVIESFVPAMIKARSGGQVVNVSSAAGLVALPWHAAYSASKYGLRGVSEVLRFDLARYKIGVTVVVPGAVNTPLVRTVEIAGVDRNNESVNKWMNRFVGHAVTPEKVADRIVEGIRHNRYLVYTSADIRALYLFKRTLWWPYSVAMRLVNLAFTNALRPGFQQSGSKNS
ncbi:SDR family oxidoreductase [Mycobacterium sp. CBMA271]|uniref:SDR family oxidoreductase n=1 Tax=unclassified Mycobacteroides TaxID=2618759 RepID=UPI0012DD4EBF|nr:MULTISPECIES: SDR family oxidoreductase [unclassified Mycobacteroides]MUM17832.1 short chain dehydrogenase [Mycobacteroides sp. CBMA 326]MUM20403.1 SDR family oxidoreductase [Mycobacteroides sp. CBMA 271]